MTDTSTEQNKERRFVLEESLGANQSQERACPASKWIENKLTEERIGEDVIQSIRDNLRKPSKLSKPEQWVEDLFIGLFLDDSYIRTELYSTVTGREVKLTKMRLDIRVDENPEERSIILEAEYTVQKRQEGMLYTYPFEIVINISLSFKGEVKDIATPKFEKKEATEYPYVSGSIMPPGGNRVLPSGNRSSEP